MLAIRQFELVADDGEVAFSGLHLGNYFSVGRLDDDVAGLAVHRAGLDAALDANARRLAGGPAAGPFQGVADRVTRLGRELIDFLQQLFFGPRFVDAGRLAVFGDRRVDG